VTVGDLVDYCLSKPGAEETYPWGEQDLAAKVGGKAFVHSPNLRESTRVRETCLYVEGSIPSRRRRHHGYPKAGSTRVVPAHCGATRK
jgi:hypothetical protein